MFSGTVMLLVCWLSIWQPRSIFWLWCSYQLRFFTKTYSDDTVIYEGHLPVWVSECLSECDSSLFNVDSITPCLVKSTLKHCSMQSATGLGVITYYHLYYLPSSHHILATLFNKLLKAETSPPLWGSVKIKLINKAGNPDDPSNFWPIALTSVVGKLFHLILSQLPNIPDIGLVIFESRECIAWMYCGIPGDIYGEGLLQVVHSIPRLIYIFFSLMLIIVNEHIYL